MTVGQANESSIVFSLDPFSRYSDDSSYMEFFSFRMSEDHVLVFDLVHLGLKVVQEMVTEVESSVDETISAEPRLVSEVGRH